MICVVVCVLFKVTFFTLCTCVVLFITNIVYIAYLGVFRQWCVTIWSLETFIILVFTSKIKNVAPFEVLTVGSGCVVFCFGWCGRCCWSVFIFCDWCCGVWCGECGIDSFIRFSRCGCGCGSTFPVGVVLFMNVGVWVVVVCERLVVSVNESTSSVDVVFCVM